MADAYPSANFSSVVTTKNIHRASYLEMMKRARIGVYTRGIHHSIAFKMAAYLAAGLCIVSEPIRYRLPNELIAGLHYLPFGTAKKCIGQCKLEDTDLWVTIRVAIHRFL
jgi:hypothetical protein